MGCSHGGRDDIEFIAVLRQGRRYLWPKKALQDRRAAVRHRRWIRRRIIVFSPIAFGAGGDLGFVAVAAVEAAEAVDTAAPPCT